MRFLLCILNSLPRTQRFRHPESCEQKHLGRGWERGWLLSWFLQERGDPHWMPSSVSPGIPSPQHPEPSTPKDLKLCAWWSSCGCPPLRYLKPSSWVLLFPEGKRRSTKEGVIYSCPPPAEDSNTAWPHYVLGEAPWRGPQASTGNSWNSPALPLVGGKWSDSFPTSSIH